MSTIAPKPAEDWKYTAVNLSDFSVLLKSLKSGLCFLKMYSMNPKETTKITKQLQSMDLQRRKTDIIKICN